MKLELLIFGTTSFILYNMHNDNKLIKILLSYKKYYQMAFILFIAFCLYIMIKRKPEQTRNMLIYTNDMIKYMPIDKTSADMLSPIIDFTLKGHKSFMGNINPTENYNPTIVGMSSQQPFNQQGSGNKPKGTKRSVSETKKKYVAYMQDWKCNDCKNKLTHTFEIDHNIRLENGGGNDVSNLVALCRECHGQKTAKENM